ncbi:hypothetical protein ACF1BQ_039460 [Bradyrhizobium sp. RDT10]
MRPLSWKGLSLITGADLHDFHTGFGLDQIHDDANRQLSKKSIVPLFPDENLDCPAIGGVRLTGPGPVQLFEIFETFDREILRLVVARFAAHAHEMPQFVPPRVILINAAVDQEVNAPRPCAGGLHDIGVSHSPLLPSTIEAHFAKVSRQ